MFVKCSVLLIGGRDSDGLRTSLCELRYEIASVPEPAVPEMVVEAGWDHGDAAVPELRVDTGGVDDGSCPPTTQDAAFSAGVCAL